MTRAHGFTIVELMVVVTIIVILLAMLAPALDRAIYQAQLAVCAANLKSIAGAATTYAAAHHRRYPHRRAVNEFPDQQDAQPTQLNDAWTNGARGADGQPLDDRPIMKQYLPLTALLDPLCDKLDMEPSATGPRPHSQTGQPTPEPWVSSGYYLFYNWRYKATENFPAQQGLLKLGDRFTWTGNRNLFRQVNLNNARVFTWDVLAQDQNSISINNRTPNRPPPGGNVQFFASHPDAQNAMHLTTYRNEPAPSETSLLGLNEGFYYVGSRWGTVMSPLRRGTIEVNTARTDTSVTRMNEVAWDEEERVTSAPIHQSGPGVYGFWVILPMQDMGR
jgi:prepilin-type N-terminal cleavage/methylation domain-containing protein